MIISNDTDGTFAATFVAFLECPSCAHMMRAYLVQKDVGARPEIAWKCHHCGCTSEDKGAKNAR